MSTNSSRLQRLARSISRVLSSIYAKTTLTPPRTSRVESTLQMLEPRQMLSVTAATLSATANVADRFELSRSSSDSSLIILKIYHDNTLFDTHSYDPALASLSFTDLTSADSLIIDYTNGNPLPASSLSLAGGSLAITGRVSSSGGNLNSLLYRPGSTAGAGHLGSGGRSIDFSSLSSLSASNIATFTFEGSADDLSPTLSADTSAVSFTNAANSINLSLSSVNRLALDLSAASDDVTLSLTGSAASSIATLAPSLPFDFATSILADGGSWNLDPTNFAFSQDLTLSSDANLTLTSSADFSAISLADDSRLTLALGANLALYTGALTLAGSGTLDLQDNSLIVDFDSSSPKADLTSAIITGRNGVDAAIISNWNGPGITSTLARTGSVAAGFDLFGIGIVDNADLADPSLNIPFSTFAGHYVDTTAVLIRYTLGGDTDNNGVVDGDDYAHLDNTYNNLLANYGWLSGDLNYDGNIDGDDYTLMDSAFNFQGMFSAPTLTVSGSASEIDEGDPFTLSFSAAQNSLTTKPIDPVNLWSIDWGDGSTSTVAGSATSATHRYLDNSPDDFVVKLTAIGLLHHYPASDTAVTVNNVAPVLTLAADSTALEGTYNATFNISDPGDNDTLSDWFILWGDGQADWGDPATLPGTQSHTYLPGTYTLTLSATDSDGDTSTATRSLTIRPAAPTGLTASAVSPVAANLTWTDNSAGESAYTIQMSTTSASTGFSNYITQPANSTSAALLSLAPDTDYWFRTNANSTSGGDSDPSNVTHIKTPADNGTGLYKVDLYVDANPNITNDMRTLTSLYTMTSPSSVLADQIEGTVTVDAGKDTEVTYTYPGSSMFTIDEPMRRDDEGSYYGIVWFGDSSGHAAAIYVHMSALQAWITTEDSAATEETSDTAAFTVHLSGQADQDVTLPFATSGQAIRGTDYALTDITSNSFTIPAGNTSLAVTLDATDDNAIDNGEDAIASLLASANYQIVTGADKSDHTTATIGDNDVAELGIVAHRAGINHGTTISESVKASHDPTRFTVLVNDDFGEAIAPGTTDDSNDSAAISENDYATGDDGNIIDPDLVKLTLHGLPSDLHSGVVSIQLSSRSAVRLFRDDGSLLYVYRPATDHGYRAAVNSDSALTLDLSKPRGYLAGLTNGDLSVWLEALQVDPDFVFQVRYDAVEPADSKSDDVHMRFADLHPVATSNLLTFGPTAYFDEDGIARSAKFRFHLEGISPGDASVNLAAARDTGPGARMRLFEADSTEPAGSHFEVYYSFDASAQDTPQSESGADSRALDIEADDLVQTTLTTAEDGFARTLEGCTKSSYYFAYVYQAFDPEALAGDPDDEADSEEFTSTGGDDPGAPTASSTSAAAVTDVSELDATPLVPEEVFPGTTANNVFGRAMLVNFRELYGAPGEIVLWAFLNAKTEVQPTPYNNKLTIWNFKAVRGWFGHSTQKDVYNRETELTETEIVIDSGLKPPEAAQALFEELRDITRLTGVQTTIKHWFVDHLADANQNQVSQLAGALRTILEMYVQKVAETAKSLAETYFKGIALVGEGANIVVAIADIAEGHYVSGVAGLLPVLGHAFAHTAVGANAVFKLQMYAGDLIGGTKRGFDAAFCKLLGKGGCFLPGTLVDTDAGPRAIESISPGDLVWAFNFDSAEWELRPVAARMQIDFFGQFVFLQFGQAAVTATGEHPIWVMDGENLNTRPETSVDVAPPPSIPGRWVNARDVLPGDTVWSVDGLLVVDDVKVSYGHATVYNLSVDDDHTFAVGNAAILVHNANAACTQEAFDTIKKLWKDWFRVAEEGTAGGETFFEIDGRRFMNSNALESGGELRVTVPRPGGGVEEIRVAFTATGPDFSPYRYINADGEGVVVNLKNYTGTRKGDEAIANELAQLANGTPKGYVWHHSEELGKMELVRKDVHGLVGHTGGVAIYKAGLRQFCRDARIPCPAVYQ